MSDIPIGLWGRRSIRGRRIVVAGFPQGQMLRLALTSMPGSEKFSLPVDDVHVLGCANVHDFSV